MYNVAEKPIKLIIFFLIFQTVSFAKSNFQMENPAHKMVKLRLAISHSEQTQGLSGLKPKDFDVSEGMLFINPEESSRTFWMIDTYFNLDIIFLDKKLVVVGIEKDAPNHPGRNEPPQIFRTHTFEAQYVLETKANSPFSKNLKLNDQLKFIGNSTLSEIILNTHQKQ
jgi:uncharacterized membrane protein (UPF0127 family)